jgi:hypothetical protein
LLSTCIISHTSASYLRADIDWTGHYTKVVEEDAAVSIWAAASRDESSTRQLPTFDSCLDKIGTGRGTKQHALIPRLEAAPMVDIVAAPMVDIVAAGIRGLPRQAAVRAVRTAEQAGLLRQTHGKIWRVDLCCFSICNASAALCIVVVPAACVVVVHAAAVSTRPIIVGK